jgi:hypothetical protein
VVATAQSTSPSGHRFYVDDCVHSFFHGHGRVVSGGPDPVVGFLDGQKCWVASDNLRAIPDDEFIVVALNLLALEFLLHLYVYRTPLTTFPPYSGRLYSSDPAATMAPAFMPPEVGWS